MNEHTPQDYTTLVAKKSEKLVTAMYMVTDLMTDNEPIKHSLRKNSVALLSSMNALAQMDIKDKITEFKSSLTSVTEIISLLHVAWTTGIVSDMNGRLLMEGFRTLQVVLEKKQPMLTKEMLAIDQEEQLHDTTPFISSVSTSSYDIMTPFARLRLEENEKDMRRIKDTMTQSRLVSKLTGDSRKRVDIKDINRQKEMYPSVRDNLIEHAGGDVKQGQTSFQTKKQSRKEEILSLFLPGVDMNIKDISAKIKGCSEKTIQRELNTLLKDNVIVRIGEKRWSRYVLKA